MMLKTSLFQRLALWPAIRRCSSHMTQQVNMIGHKTERYNEDEPSGNGISNMHTPHNTPLHTRHSGVENVRPEDQRFLKAAIIGVPNAGKSTLVNQILGQKVFAVSPKRHTTLQRAIGVFTEGTAQVVLLDTPGLIPYREGRKLNVTKQFLTDPSRSIMEADIVMVMVDSSNKHTRERLDPNIVRILRANQHIPSLLVLNKVDLLSHKHVLLSVTEGLTGTMERQDKLKQISDLTRKLRNEKLPDKVRAKFDSIIDHLKLEMSILDRPVSKSSTFNHRYGSPNSVTSRDIVPLCLSEESPSQIDSVYRHSHSWPDFTETFMVSSLTGDGVDSLKSYLVSHACEGEWQYSPCEVTDQSDLNLVEDIVREKLFEYLEKEIPYVVKQDNVLWESNEDGVLVIYQNINCRTHKQASIVIGPMGKTIQAITTDAVKDIEKLLNCKIDLTLNVKSHKK